MHTARWMVMVLLIPAAFLCFMAPAATADSERKLWTNLCASCHDGETAPSADVLKEKYQTVEKFRDAVVNKGARCMNILKNDEGLIQKIGLELGLRE